MDENAALSMIAGREGDMTDVGGGPERSCAITITYMNPREPRRSSKA
jgi:hypothetical protein